MIALRKILPFILSFALMSCTCARRIEYVDREVVKYEVKHDTVMEQTHDSIYVSLIQKGDTVYSTKYVERTRYRYKVFVDTCYRDSIRVEYKERIVRETTCPKIYRISFAICILLLIFAIYRLIRWLTRMGKI